VLGSDDKLMNAFFPLAALAGKWGSTTGLPQTASLEFVYPSPAACLDGQHEPPYRRGDRCELPWTNADKAGCRDGDSIELSSLSKPALSDERGAIAVELTDDSVNGSVSHAFAVAADKCAGDVDSRNGDCDGRVEGQSAEGGTMTVASVLVVDDDRINRVVLRRFCEMAGHRVVDVPSGADAVALVSQSADRLFDIVFMDFQMPNMDGAETTRRIIAHRSDYVVCGVSGDCDEVMLSICRAAGMVEVILKPWAASQIETTIARALARAQAGGEVGVRPFQRHGTSSPQVSSDSSSTLTLNPEASVTLDVDFVSSV